MNLTMPPNKTFDADICVFKHKLENGINFTFSKYADGEWAVLENRGTNNSEFWFNPENDSDTYKREKLVESFLFQHPQYYVGISCPCCQGQKVFEEMMEMCEQPQDRLTWANLWVNRNYRYYLSDILPAYSKKKTVLYCHENGDLGSLPFTPSKVFPISEDAWGRNWNLVEDSKQYIANNSIEDHVFLFCCGPFGNILCHQLTEFSDKNTYLDIGSTLNPFLKCEGFRRDYYMGNNFFANRACIWKDFK